MADLILKCIKLLTSIPGSFYIYIRYNFFLKKRKSQYLGNICTKKFDLIKKSHPTDKNILIATSTGGHFYATLLESVIAYSLTLRGYNVDILICDQVLDACLMRIWGLFDISPKKSRYECFKCKLCFSAGKKVFNSLGFSPLLYSQFITKEKIEEITNIVINIDLNNVQKFVYHDYLIGEHAYAGALRYFARANIDEEPDRKRIIQEYLKSSIITVEVIENILKNRKYTVACFHHGIYVPHGIIGEVLRKNHIRIVNWVVAYRRQTYIFSHDDTYHHTMISENCSHWENIQWNEKKQQIIENYLHTRRYGKNDWIYFHDNPEENFAVLSELLNVDTSKPYVLLLTNVMWDAQLHYPSNAFPDMLSWIIASIQYFLHRDDIQLVIRIHPAEIHGSIKSRQPIYNEILNKFGKLPKNIIIVKPDHKVSSYALAEKSNAVLIYNTKMGIEVACMGKPVIVAGEAWIRGKGFSMDAFNEHEYYGLLDQIPFCQLMDKNSVDRAKKYAFHFFFRRMIPIDFIKADDKDLDELYFNINNCDVFLPGGHTGLDVICNGIIHGTPFIYDKDE